MKLEAGKTYVDRNGNEVTVVSYDSSPYRFTDLNAGYRYLTDGRLFTDEKNSCDLIREAEEPKMKLENIVFDVEDKPELARAIEARLEELGYPRVAPLIGVPLSLYVTDSKCHASWTKASVIVRDGTTLKTLSDLYDIEPQTHTITIDGKEIEISHESYLAFKDKLI